MKNNKKQKPLVKSIKVRLDAHKKLRMLAVENDTNVINIIDALLVDKENMKKQLTINK